MLIGTDYKKKSLKREKWLQKQYDLMIPHQVFAWFPIKMETGQYAWLQRVWRIGYNYSALKGRPVFVHYLNREEALRQSRSLNYYYGSERFGVGEEARRRLGK